MSNVAEIDFSELQTKQRSAIRLSPQQVDILDWVENGEGNGLIIAVAGAGKTSTLIEALAMMQGSIAFAAYNKAISLEIQDKVKRRGVGAAVKVGTFHSFGYRAWSQEHNRPDVKPYKIKDILRNYRHKDGASCPRTMHTFVEKLVSMVRSAGVGVFCEINKGAAWDAIIEHHDLAEELTDSKPWQKAEIDEEELAALVAQGKIWGLRILRESIRVAREENIIDFDDQLYMPLLDGLYIEQFDWVLVDEAQDTNPVRLEWAARMLKPGGRFLAVGDPMQAIYGFTGADSESLNTIEERFNTTAMDLTVSFRCPKAVVQVARQFASHIESADDAPEGSVYDKVLEDTLRSFVGANAKSLENSAVLCRKNAPIVSIAFGLLRQHVPCHVEGRDIGGQIITLATKWKSVEYLPDLLKRVDTYRESKIKKHLDAHQEMQAAAIEDKCATLTAIAQGLLNTNPNATVNDLVDTVRTIFQDGEKTGLTLASVHRSKGREWDNVYLLGQKAYMPSPFARQEWQIKQEINLQYVAVTRAKKVLINVAMPSKHDGGEEGNI